MDVFTKEKRSQIMARVRGKNTKPELMVRSVLHGMGYRFRLHRKDLPGNPDIVLPKHKKVIFVHGCFWHGHSTCLRSKRPTTNQTFWDNKLDGNIKRDRRFRRELRRLDWEVLTVWECETKNSEKLLRKLERFLLGEKTGKTKTNKS
jgi:DNA mismatch endonuclease, patch repair protein